MNALAQRLKLSKAEAAVLLQWASAPAVGPEMAETALDRLLYRNGTHGIVMRLRLALASARAASLHDETSMLLSAKLSTLLGRAERFKKPVFPLGGADIMAAGVPAGPRVGEILSGLEETWIEFNFSLDRAALTTRLHDIVKS
jgi:poly(A) polymerase